MSRFHDHDLRDAAMVVAGLTDGEIDVASRPQYPWDVIEPQGDYVTSVR